MKKLLIALMLVAGSALADTAATMQNGHGGTTVLTDVDCDSGRGFIVYSQNPTGTTFFGCWWSDSTMVHITWQDGDFRSYPFKIFTLNIPVLDRMRVKNRKAI
jgi:hypothetical protein